MKAKKIIGSIAKLTAVSGMAYLAYKFGEYHGKEQEHQKHIDKSCDFDDNIYTEGEPYEPHFKPVSGHVDGITNEMMNQALMLVCSKNTVSNKAVRERLNVDFDTAENILNVFQQSGYVDEGNSHFTRKSNLTLPDYPELCIR